MIRQCGACGARDTTPFQDETFTIEHADMSASVESLSGWRCAACGEVEFDETSGQRYEDANDRLVAMRAGD
jgi:HTH-type transcriptional regulator / antitoxin MqsA